MLLEFCQRHLNNPSNRTMLGWERVAAHPGLNCQRSYWEDSRSLLLRILISDVLRFLKSRTMCGWHGSSCISCMKRPNNYRQGHRVLLYGMVFCNVFNFCQWHFLKKSRRWNHIWLGEEHLLIPEETGKEDTKTKSLPHRMGICNVLDFCL